MSSKDMFRKEQRFSFRKFSFGLASAVIANVIFGGAIASSPVVHANTATETAAVATSERTASLSYTVNIVDQAGKVVDTQTKTVSVKTTEATASTTAYLTTDLVPTGYALVSGLGQVTVTENATNVFTVRVEEIASEAVLTAASESATSTTAVSESATATSEVAASETATSESATATSEVAASETATSASETSAKKAERTAYLSYVTQYVNEEKEIVDSKGHLVAVTTTDETAKTQVTVSASENMPAGYELAQEKAEVVLQLVENQANVLAFAVAKKSEEEEIAESQLSNRDVLTQVTSEADLLADEALRQVAGEQAGNTALETAANDTKAAAAAANQVLANAAATEAELGAQIDTVRTSTQNLAAEMLKVDADGVLTAQLNTGTNQAPTITPSGTGSTNPFTNTASPLRKIVYIFGRTTGDTEAVTTAGAEDGEKAKAPIFDRAIAQPVAVITDADSTSIKVNYGDATAGNRLNNLGSTMVATAADGTVLKATDGTFTNVTLTNGTANIYLGGTYDFLPGGKYTRQFIISDESGTEVRGEAFYTVSYTDKLVDNQPIAKNQDVALTEEEVFAKLTLDVKEGKFPDTNPNLTVPESEVTRTIVGYRTVDGKTKGDLVKQTDLAQFPKDKDLEVRVKTTNAYGQTIYNWVKVDYNLKPSMPTIGVTPNVIPNNNDSRKLEVLHVFGNVTGTTEAVSSAGEEKAPDFDTTKATKSFLATDSENETVTLTYGVPGNITAYEAGNPDSLTANGSNLISAETKNIGAPNTTQLLLNDEGKLTGELPLNPGQFYSRIIKMTDTAGNESYSNPFYVITYTDKRADDTDLTVAAASDLTEANIFGKLTIDTVSGSVNPALTVPESEYSRKIVGYRLKDTTDVIDLSASTLNTLPAGQNYEIKVETTNPYGQTIYNWVPVNDTRTVGTDKKPLYVFNNTPIATVGAGTDEADNVNKVKVVTLKDPDGINSVEVTRETDVNTGIFTPGDIGITIDKDGNASGTPKVGPIGVYSRGLTVTDGNGAIENLFPRDNEMQTYVLDATAGATITKAVGETVTEAEILDNVTVNTGNSNTMDAAIDSRYRKVLAPGQTVPTAPGEYDVKVRVITESNVYKDVTVKVIIPKYSDTLTATAAENTSLVPGSGTAVSQPIAITKAADGSTTTAPAGTTYEIDPAFKAEKEALGYEISVSPTGEVSVKAPAGQEADITVPVTVTYPDKTTDSVSVPFKVDQKGLAQLKATEALDEEATAAKEAIDNNPNLSEDEKQAAKEAVDAEAEKAKQAVADATTIDEVDAAKEAGTTNVDGK
ncbi:TPA: YPDG domain-containing protein, partial [Streptococcus suis]|nr:YPDG domain-containing protein [Streptococcus suis]